jgi:hypothetical protein
MPIEPDSRFILRVDNEREDRRFRPHCARDRVDDEQAAQAPPAKIPVDGEPAD